MRMLVSVHMKLSDEEGSFQYICFLNFVFVLPSIFQVLMVEKHICILCVWEALYI